MSKLLSLVIIVMTTFSCANISTPTGGPEDETPPTLIRSIPEDGQTNYQGNTILLSFDERVQTKSIETDLIITPKPEGSFRTRTNKNNVLLTFFEPFKDNTTYSFSFASTIQDITNNNPGENINLSFSTGDYIDSISVSGNIINLYNQEPIENTLVSLYTQSDSLDILKGSASYYSKTDSAGNYTFRNLPAGNFRIYAVKDKNNNNKADSESESYGFYPDTLRLQESISDINFTIQNLNTSKLRTTSARTFGTYYDITFNKAITNFEILSPGEFIYDKIEDEKFRFYRNNRLYSDTTQLIFTVTDSLNLSLTDTAGFYFNESKLKPTKFETEILPRRDALAPNDTITLTFTKPIISVNTDSLFYQLDSLTQIPVLGSELKWNKYKTALSIPITIKDMLNKSRPSIVLTLKEAAFISIDRDSSEAIQRNLTLLKTEDSAVIGGTIQTDAEDVIVQLLDATSLKIIRESNSKDYLFEFLQAGRYMVRVIQDLNGNGLWDTGNIFTKESPEPALFYFDQFYNTKTIEVRKNWEQTDVNISF